MTTTATLDRSSTAPASRITANQVLAFTLAGQQYAVDILQVSEIRRFSEATALPDVPPHVLGVINLRGTVVPVFDLRVRFGLPPIIDRNVAVIVVTVDGCHVGLVVDQVVRVLNVTPDMLRPTPPLPAAVDGAFLIGLLAAGENLITCLDVVHLLRPELHRS